MGEPGGSRGTSRRAKPAPSEAAPPGRSHLWKYGLVLAVVVVIFLLKNTDGGPDTAYQGGAASQMALVEWQYTAVEPAHDTSMVQCGSQQACDGAAMAEAAERDADCRLEATYWLVSAELPIVSFGIEGNAHLRSLKIDVAAIRDNGTGVEFRDDNQSLPWDGGAWWKAGSEHVTVQADVLCNLHQFVATFRMEGRAWFGERWSDQQQHTVLVQAPEFPDDARSAR